ncbi:MAG TPA: hypothetical protein VF384_09700 [Planctomycetota bacterium]
MRTSRSCLVPLLLLASCGSHHVLAGNWVQVMADGKVGVQVQIDETGTRIQVHGAPRPEGGHGHPEASFTFDEATRIVTIECALLGDGKATTWKGSVDGDRLELSSADGKLTLQRRDQVSGH